MKSKQELNMKEICERLNEVKQIRKLSNQDIATAGNTTAQTVNTMIKGEVKKANYQILTDICTGLKVDSEWLLFGKGRPVTVLEVGSSNISITEQMYREALDRISELKENLDNTNYTIRLQREVMRNAGLHFKVVTEDRPPVCKMGRLVRLVHNYQKIIKEQGEQLQSA